jgi:hypothetical protein
MPILWAYEPLQSHDSLTQLPFRAGEAALPEPGIPDGLAHQVSVRAVNVGGVVDYFVVCACGFVSAPSVWRPQHVSVRDCEVSEVLRRIASNRVEFNRLATAREAVVHV